jgi:hypothetical protein
MEDIRIAILRYFKESNISTEEHPLNEWLEKQNDDLGTIRRALIELIENDFLIISNLDKEHSVSIVKKEYDTTTHSNPLTENDKIKKSSKRLIEDLHNLKKIKELKFITTINGIKFLIEFDKLKDDSKLSKWQKKWFWVVAVIGLVGLILSILTFLK